MADTLRLFIAVELQEELARYIGGTVGELRRQGIIGVRWVRGEGVHLTLKFLGNVTEEQVPGILSSMRNSAVGTSPFVLHVQGAGAFPNMRAPRSYGWVFGEIWSRSSRYMSGWRRPWKLRGSTERLGASRRI